jgi:Ser/Thr protein kinase RdoA (MazF antagonist)
MRPDEDALTGNVTAGIVRVGDTVRRPAGPHTDAVDALLTHLHEVGFTGAPRPLGRDGRGRQVLEFVPGEMTMEIDPRDLPDIGRMLRDLHAATAEFTPPPGAVWHTEIPPVGVPGSPAGELICHHDAAPWNLVRAERGWVLIDWDNAGPGSRAWELAYASLTCCGMRPEQPVPESAARLRSFVVGFGLAPGLRPALARLLGVNAGAMYDLLATGARDGRQPWARIFTEDGPFWRGVADYLGANTEEWASALG